MSDYDLLIRNGTLVTPQVIVVGDVGIAGGRIAALGADVAGTADEELDASGLHIFPGAVDAHVHFNEPGRDEWEGFATGTRALAAGGTTTYCDMPLNAHPPTVDGASFDLKLAAARAASLVDFAFWGGLVPGNIERMSDDMDELAKRGVMGFKAFMADSGIEDFAAVDDLTLYEGMGRAARLGLPVAVHAENDAITRGLAERAQARGATGIRDYLASRPVVAELEAISRAMLFARETGCALHVVHVSTGRGVALVAEARAEGVNVTCETCPHYLVLTDEDMERLGAVAKCAPPLRAREDVEALWRHIFDGTLPMVATDHSPAPAAMKSDANFFRVWGGISGCQSLLSLLLSEGYAERGLPLETIAQLVASFPATRFRLPGKGQLAVDCDADLALVDLTRDETLRPGDLLYRHPHSPYVGRRMRGVVVRTLLRGQTVWCDGQTVSAPIGQLACPTATRVS